MAGLTPKGTAEFDDIHLVTRDLRRLLRLGDGNLQPKTGNDRERLLKELKIEGMKHIVLQECNKVRALKLELSRISVEPVPEYNMQNLRRLFQEERRKAERLKAERNAGSNQMRTSRPGFPEAGGLPRTGSVSSAIRTTIAPFPCLQRTQSSMLNPGPPAHQPSFQDAPIQHHGNHPMYPQQNWITATMPQTSREFSIANFPESRAMPTTGHPITKSFVSSSMVPAGYQARIPTETSSMTPAGYQTKIPSDSPSMASAGYKTRIPSNSPSMASAGHQTRIPSNSPSMAPAGYQTRHVSSSMAPAGYQTRNPSETSSMAPAGYQTRIPSDSPSMAPAGYQTRNPSETSSMASAGHQTRNLPDSPSMAPAGYQMRIPSDSFAMASAGYQTRIPSDSPAMAPAGYQTRIPFETSSIASAGYQTRNLPDSPSMASAGYQTRNLPDSPSMAPAGYQTINSYETPATTSIGLQQFKNTTATSLDPGFSFSSVAGYQKLRSSCLANQFDRQQPMASRYIHESTSTGNIPELDGQQPRRGSYSTPRSSSPYRQERLNAVSPISPSQHLPRRPFNTCDLPEDLGQSQRSQNTLLSRQQEFRQSLETSSGLPNRQQFSRSNSIQGPLENINNNKSFKHSSQIGNSPIATEIRRQAIQPDSPSQIQQHSIGARLIVDARSPISALQTSEAPPSVQPSSIHGEEDLKVLDLDLVTEIPTGPEALRMLNNTPNL